MLLLGALAGLAAGAAGASAANSEPSKVVTFSPAMLDTDSGARAVYHRIAKAAEQVCPNVSYSLLVSETVLKCRAQAISAAVGKIHNQRLAAIHAAAASKAG